MASDALCYVKNTILHTDHYLSKIPKLMKNVSKKFFDKAVNHPNPLLVSAATYEAPQHLLRKPRNALTDLTDDFTAKACGKDLKNTTSSIFGSMPSLFAKKMRNSAINVCVICENWQADSADPRGRPAAGAPLFKKGWLILMEEIFQNNSNGYTQLMRSEGHRRGSVGSRGPHRRESISEDLLLSLHYLRSCKSLDGPFCMGRAST
ncbi:hypothetical protein EVAR_8393_1 [Eumeta japonica]|uniref:Uncharacterized protein n=1 Tax=Eumeta variegata TaxID=151549 RepID=A0A4C1VBM7_EUMVA|nr:hypothetical protein EVAR_8393_1 [Eumeta japonica]